jgi:hypothetical protein
MASAASRVGRALRSDLKLRLRYGAVGLVIGIIWVAHGGEPAWEHALRALVLVLVAVPLLHWVDRRRSTADPRAAHLAIGRLVATKLLLVTVAFLADWTLGHWTSASSAIVAVALVVGLTAGGPNLHRLIVVPGGPDPVPVTEAPA